MYNKGKIKNLFTRRNVCHWKSHVSVIQNGVNGLTLYKRPIEWILRSLHSLRMTNSIVYQQPANEQYSQHQHSSFRIYNLFQCASAQSFPSFTFTSIGTFISRAFSISSFTIALSSFTSPFGASNTSSSWTCKIIFAVNLCLCILE